MQFMIKEIEMKIETGNVSRPIFFEISVFKILRADCISVLSFRVRFISIIF